jgi:hypothetical protein
MHIIHKYTALRSSFAFASLFFVVAGVQAQSRYIPEQHVRFYAKQPTELDVVIREFLTSQEAFPEIIVLNPGIDPTNIQPKQSVILPRKWLRYTQTQAQISYLRCNTAIKIENSDTLLKAGSSLKQGDVVHIPALCQLSIQFQDESTIRMPSGGTIKIATLRTNPFETTPEVHIELLDGRVEVKVAKKQRADGTFEVRTPRSVAGVRGTDFRVGFDAENGKGQVEVSKGLISARDLQTKINTPLPEQFGIAMPDSGMTGRVEPLPPITSFNSIQTQHDPEWLLFVFNPSTDAEKYFLSEYSNANLIDALEKKSLPAPRFLTTEPLPTARFLQWIPTKANGLQGDSRVFGVCDGVPKQQPYRCDVRFNLSGTYNAQLRVYKIDTSGSKKLFLKNTKPMRSLNDAIVRSMQAGLYSWEISYQVDAENPLIFKQAGEFELLTVVRP